MSRPGAYASFANASRPWTCHLCKREMRICDKKRHLRSKILVGNRWICVGLERHPGYKRALAHRLRRCPEKRRAS